MINDDKTEFLLIGTRQQLAKIILRAVPLSVNATLIRVCV